MLSTNVSCDGLLWDFPQVFNVYDGIQLMTHKLLIFCFNMMPIISPCYGFSYCNDLCMFVGYCGHTTNPSFCFRICHPFSIFCGFCIMGFQLKNSYEQNTNIGHRPSRQSTHM